MIAAYLINSSGTSEHDSVCVCVLPLGRLFQGGWVGLGDLEQDPHGVELVVGGLDLGHLDQGDPQGPNVCLVVVRSILHGLTHHHLWGHPGHTHRHTETHTERHTHTETDTHTQRDTYTETQKDITHRETHRETHTETHTQG